MQGWLLISSEGTESRKDFDFWAKTALDFNVKIVTSRPNGWVNVTLKCDTQPKLIA